MGVVVVQGEYYFPEEKSFFEVSILGHRVPPVLVIGVGFFITIFFHNDWMGILIGFLLVIGGAVGLVAERMKKS